MREIRSVYFEKRRKIQKLSKYKPLTAKRLLRKYSGREKLRMKELRHEVAKRMVDVAKSNSLGIVMEDLKWMRRMNRGLHSLPYRKLQFYIEYKARLNGLPIQKDPQAYARYVALSYRRMGIGV